MHMGHCFRQILYLFVYLFISVRYLTADYLQNLLINHYHISTINCPWSGIENLPLVTVINLPWRALAAIL